MVVDTIAMIVNSPGIFDVLSEGGVNMIMLLPSVHKLLELGPLGSRIFLIFLLAGILASVAYALLDLSKNAKAAGGITKPGAVKSTAVLWAGIFMCITILLDITHTTVTISDEATLGTVMVSEDILQEMYSLVQASVWEEVITRMVYIGLPIMVISLIITRRKESLKCLFGGFGMSWAAVVLIMISSVIFGFAHSGWGYTWKIISTGISGTFLGYLFVRFGIYASILLHFLVDYLQSFLWLGLGTEVQGVIIWVCAAFGVFALFYLLKRIYDGREQKIPSFRSSHVSI
ncbi:MAG: CPBP family intramembrane metalloprotease [Candidatus Methanoplasma sp.]|jgi:hypothetical protein|nr:CPBP family intramembrane metalloprotease [Candidatus Methanoplasma sp.]